MTEPFPPPGYDPADLEHGLEMTSQQCKQGRDQMVFTLSRLQLEQLHRSIGYFLEQCGYPASDQERSIIQSISACDSKELVITELDHRYYLISRIGQEWELFPARLKARVSLPDSVRAVIQMRHELLPFQIVVPRGTSTDTVTCFWITNGITVPYLWQHCMQSGIVCLPGYQLLRVQYRILLPESEPFRATLLFDNPNATLYYRKSHAAKSAGTATTSGKITITMLLRAINLRFSFTGNREIIVMDIKQSSAAARRTEIHGAAKVVQFFKNFALLCRRLMIATGEFVLFDFSYPLPMEGMIVYPECQVSRDDLFRYLKECFDTRTADDRNPFVAALFETD
jgi:hypothetical protein